MISCLIGCNILHKTIKGILERHSLSIPKDISVASFDGLLLSEIILPKITTIRQDAPSIGKCAANLLMEAIESPGDYCPRTVKIPGIVIEGESVASID